MSRPGVAGSGPPLPAAGHDPGAGEVLVQTTHLATEQPLREKQVNHLLENYPPGDGPQVLAGDFNLQPTGALHPVIEDAGWTDSWKELIEDNPDCPEVRDGCTHTSIDPDRRIDYVFHTSSVDATTSIRIVSAASDHLPVHIEPGLAPASSRRG